MQSKYWVMGAIGRRDLFKSAVYIIMPEPAFVVNLIIILIF
jgi:hypothetical protein